MSPSRDIVQLEEQVETIREQVAHWQQPSTADAAPTAADEDNVTELCQMLEKLHEAEESLREVARG
ncbi:MAG: hypothetical protein JSS27_01960 [Planctomycetes bacterium]|nr:hypothetical protein [Planctomycetota bacterium]